MNQKIIFFCPTSVLVCNDGILNQIKCQNVQIGQKRLVFFGVICNSSDFEAKMQKLQFKSKNPKGHISISSFDIFFQHIFIGALQSEGDVGEMAFSEMYNK